MAPTIAYFVVAEAIRVVWCFSFFFIHPFFALVGSISPDMLDASALWHWRPLDHALYEQSDKIVDSLHLLAGAAFFWRFRAALWYGRWLVAFALFRLVGHAIFLFAWPDERVLIVFPNVFDTLLFLFGLLDVARRDGALRRSRAAQCAAAAAVTLLTVGRELAMHLFFAWDARKYAAPGALGCGPDIGKEMWATLLACALCAYAGATTWPAFDEARVARNRLGAYALREQTSAPAPAPAYRPRVPVVRARHV